MDKLAMLQLAKHILLGIGIGAGLMGSVHTLLLILFGLRSRGRAAKINDAMLWTSVAVAISGGGTVLIICYLNR